MSRSAPAALALLFSLSACGGGSPALQYGVPTPNEVRYTSADTTTVGVSAMGQSIEIAQRATAEYAVSFASAPSGVQVTMRIASLAGTITQPMGAPVRVDESDVEGALTFTLDRNGNATVTGSPEVSLEASQMVSGLALAHGFFPGLPGRGVASGESWVDTIRYEGDEGAGRQSAESVIRYTVAGDTILNGRSLLVLTMEGTTASEAELTVSGMSVSQRSTMDVRGHVLWDDRAGLMVERFSRVEGTGTASVPVAPAPMPIQLRGRQHVRLVGM